jgi:predicted site-specific integrase-resolvase
MTKTSYISVEEVSKLLMVDRSTIKEWVKVGKFLLPTFSMKEAVFGAMRLLRTGLRSNNKLKTSSIITTST